MNDETPQPPNLTTSELIRRTAVVTITVLAIVGLILLLWRIRSIVLWVVIGIVLAIALQPVVGWLERHRWNRVLASLVVSLAAVLVIAGVIVAIAWPVVTQADDFIRALPGLVDSLFGRGGALRWAEVNLHVLERLRSITPGQVGKVLMGNQATIVSALTRAASIVAATVTILTIMVMLLIEGPRAWLSVTNILVGEQRVWAERIGQNFLRSTGGYVRGNLAISAWPASLRTSSSRSSACPTPRPSPCSWRSSTSSRWSAPPSGR